MKGNHPHNMNIRTLAVYLPQFHPFPENDRWWGKGFTEWTNTAKARPLFEGHYQPHLPADLGFYDLRLEQVRKEQAALAKQYGIYGFCYYHYWFNGTRLMNAALDGLLQSGQPDLPFMYCWANENWTRRWDGNDAEVLIQQNYSPEDDLEHIRYLCREVFADPRYIRVDGKPFFAIYRPTLLPDLAQTLRTWRNEAQQLGIGELYLAYMQGFQVKEDPLTMGFDAAIEFQPDFYDMPAPYMGTKKEQWMDKLGLKPSVYKQHKIVSYPEYVQRMMARTMPPYKQYPSVTPMWDNTARRKENAFVMTNSSPAIYEAWLRNTIEKFKPYSAEENFVFINAWNEWAEGNHLEPDQQWGRAYLEATQRALESKK